MSNRRTEFTAAFFIAVNEETGEEFYLQTDTEIDEELKLAAADFEQRLEERRFGGEKPDAQTKLKEGFEASQSALRARLVRDRDIAKSGATEYRYTLIKPDYGEFLRIQAESMLHIGPGETSFDALGYQRRLLMNDGVMKERRILSADEIDGLPPLVATVLGTRLARALEPDRRRMVFTFRRSEPT